MTIAEFDHLGIDEKKALLHQCCGSANWINKVIAALPAEDLIDLLEIAEEQWYACNEQDWREAFGHHPKIGDLNSLKDKYASTGHWAEGEQASVKQATEQTLRTLVEDNQEYEKKFGYIFVVFATGKTADEMLSILKQRLYNSPETEILVAMEEQLKITKLRLEKLFGVS